MLGAASPAHRRPARWRSPGRQGGVAPRVVRDLRRRHDLPWRCASTTTFSRLRLDWRSSTCTRSSERSTLAGRFDAFAPPDDTWDCTSPATVRIVARLLRPALRTNAPIVPAWLALHRRELVGGRGAERRVRHRPPRRRRQPDDGGGSIQAAWLASGSVGGLYVDARPLTRTSLRSALASIERRTARPLDKSATRHPFAFAGRNVCSIPSVHGVQQPRHAVERARSADI